MKTKKKKLPQQLQKKADLTTLVLKAAINNKKKEGSNAHKKST